MRDKVKEVPLLKSKLEVLQRVVHRVKSRADDAASNATMWQEKSEAKDLEVQNLTQSLEDLQHKFRDQQSTAYETQIRLEARFQSAKSAWEAERSEFLRKDALVRERVQAMQKDVFDLDQNYELTQQQLFDAQRQLESQEELAKADVEKESARRKKLERELEEVRDNMQILEQKKMEAEDAVEIAKASVLASESRETELAVRLNETQAAYDEALKASRSLKQELVDFEQERDEWAAMQNSTRASVAGMEALRLEIGQLEEQIRSQRSVHASERRSDKKKFQEKVEILQRQYDDALARMRDRYPATTPTRRRQPPQEPAGRSRRFWQRLRSRFIRRD